MQNFDPLINKILNTHDQALKTPANTPCCFIGFDGFTDKIISPVDQRIDKNNFKSIPTMNDFADRIRDASGKSCNIELVVDRVKIGGNAPILTNALLEGGHRVTFAGAIGEPGSVEPIFRDMASRCEHVISLCPSGHTDAIEFQDGKVLLGKHQVLERVNYDSLLEQMGRDELTSILEKADLWVSVNWTMLPMMTRIWKSIAEELCPKLTKRKRLMFVDMADPAKRTDQDLLEAIEILKNLNNTFEVILGLNQAEASRVAEILLCKSNPEEIQKKSGLNQVIIHTQKSAIGYDGKKLVEINSPYVPNPVIKTGAGDNFNAGFCNGLLYKLKLEECLICGVFTAGYYVRKGKSPSIPELTQFMKQYLQEEKS